MIQLVALALLCSLVRAASEHVAESEGKPCGELQQPCSTVGTDVWVSYPIPTARKQTPVADWLWYLGFGVNTHGELHALAPTAPDGTSGFPVECGVTNPHEPYMIHLNGQKELSTIRCSVFYLRRSTHLLESRSSSKAGYRTFHFASITDAETDTEVTGHEPLDVELRLLCGSERLSGISSPQAKFAQSGAKYVVTLATPSFCQERKSAFASPTDSVLPQKLRSKGPLVGDSTPSASSQCVLQPRTNPMNGAVLQPGVDLSKTFSVSEMTFEHSLHSYRFYPCSGLTHEDAADHPIYLEESGLNSKPIHLVQLVDRYRWATDGEGVSMIQAIFASSDMRAMFTVQAYCVRFAESASEYPVSTGVTVRKIDRQLHVDGVLNVQLSLTVELCRTL
jgi:hypothetical protein